MLPNLVPIPKDFFLSMGILPSPCFYNTFCQIGSARKLLVRPIHTFLVFSWSETSDMMMQEMGTNPDNYQLIKSLEYYQMSLLLSLRGWRRGCWRIATVMCLATVIAKEMSRKTRGKYDNCYWREWESMRFKTMRFNNLNKKTLAAGIHRSRLGWKIVSYILLQ